MKKQILTKQEIQKQLLKEINKSRPLWIFLTVFTSLSIVAYLFSFTQDDGFSLFWVIAFPLLILFLLIISLRYYWIDLLDAKKGKFRVFKEPLCEKKQEWWYPRYGKPVLKNWLYFRCGILDAPEELYANAKVGDVFYVVVLNTRGSVRLAFQRDLYDIQDMHVI